MNYIVSPKLVENMSFKKVIDAGIGENFMVILAVNRKNKYES